MAKKFTTRFIETVQSVDIRLFIPTLGTAMRRQMKTDCPFCKEKKGLLVTYGKNQQGAQINLAHCFKCGKSLTGPIDAVMHYEGKKYRDAVLYIAEHESLKVEYEDVLTGAALKKALESTVKSFRDEQLEASGLTEADIMVKAKDDHGETREVCPMVRGTFGDGGRPMLYGDDMLIYYYDLEGRLMTYVKQGTGGTIRPYIRIRYSNPAAHSTKNGDEPKYMSPAGAGCRIYVPQRVRDLYQSGEQIETLFLQEGEKKAEKACKHGIMSLALQGIFNIGSKESGPLEEIGMVAKRCRVKNIVFLMDSDWDDLSRNLINNDRADQRPNQFAQAVIKYKDYINSFHSMGLSVNVWWGHVNINERGDKGIDDLLCGTLKGSEDLLAEDITKAMSAHDGHGKYADIHKISAKSDYQIRDFWALNSAQAFFERHAERLSKLETFKFNGVGYAVEDGKVKRVSAHSSSAELWRIETDEKLRRKVVFNIVEAIGFINNNGFCLLRTQDNDGTPTYDWIYIDDGIISYTSPTEIRRFVQSYVNGCNPEYIVKEFFYNKLDTVLSDKKLERSEIRDDNFTQIVPNKQTLHFSNQAVSVTANDITPLMARGEVWRNRIMPRDFARVQVFKDVSKNDDGTYNIETTEAGDNCEFLRFLLNISNNHTDPGEDVTPEQYNDIKAHLINKLTALGYLLVDYKPATERVAVIVQDHTMSEVGQSHGGAGKSILGLAIKHMTSQVFIDGKKIGTEDRFTYERVTKATRNIYIDDVKVNFNFESLYPMITGDMTIDRKNIGALTIKAEQSPKILISTNHAINKAAMGSSARRIAYMECSGWYNNDYDPIKDFGHMLFDDWDDEQWTLFYNLMAECVMLYLRSYQQGWSRPGRGIIPPPMQNILLRTLRQSMGETFLQWAEEYFDESGSHLNVKIAKKEMYAAFEEYAGHVGHGVTLSNFKSKILTYCEYKGYHFNPDRPNKNGVYYKDRKNTDDIFVGERDVVNGRELFKVYCPAEPDDSTQNNNNNPF